MKLNKGLFTALISIQLFAQASVALAYSIPAPPAKGSAAEKEDFRILHEYQNDRTEEQCEAANLQTSPTFEAMFGPTTGILTAQETQQVKEEADQITAKVIAITDPYKDFYHRMRPYNEDPTLHPCIVKPNGSRAYPSSHSAVGIVLAAFLAQKFPAKKAAILEEGNQVGINRLIGGVHHPSDVAAGQSLGKQIVKDLAHL